MPINYPLAFTERWESFNEFIASYGWYNYKKVPKEFYDEVEEVITNFIDTYYPENNMEYDDNELYNLYFNNCSIGGYVLRDFYNQEEWFSSDTE